MKTNNNKKKIAIAVAACAICASSVLAIGAPTAQAASYYKLSASTVYNINTSSYQTVPLIIRGQAAGFASYLINETTYVPLRAFVTEFCEATVSFNSSTRTATVKADGLTVTVTDGCHYIIANGRYLYAMTPAEILSDNTLYVPVRSIAKALGLTVGWDTSARSASITGTYSPILSGDKYYDSDSLYWLSRIISAESRGEELLGQIAVGNVVLNRVASPSYPNTIYGVIFDKRGGTQFSPVSFGTIYNPPSSSAVIAAKICLEGFTVSDRILFFYEPNLSTSNWIGNNRPYAFTIGHHKFHY